ncbi:alpha/beta fold hydrolase [Paraurantiacibacter namhicola]|uniref:Putative hydrolase n=1 Tax=Paraurantiacibacter namhicola TaxID=645517 RepID=A0A1C7D4K3_9SPHN|nr:alpha/beta hydrolase [Paraurantiacibacter namhicola]ANU06388.1 putative hydrolase [Paraurantiacibacter namhicola]
MTITRHMLTLPGSGRRVHYRVCGSGPALLMVHQSPRSGAEYEALMREWGAHFTCIAPDTPGFGQSDPLPGEPDIADFADGLSQFVDALGIAPVAAYGFHSGGIILVTLLKRHPQMLRCLAVGGYAIWTPEEMALFGTSYLPEWHPAPYGEHLTWLWNRMLEQSWFFPWFDTREEARLSVAHADLPRVQQAVMEMLDSGNAYRAGYGAVLRAPRDIPAPGSQTPPVLITAYDGDPLQEHIDRLGEMPAGWEARKVATPEDHRAQSLAFLLEHASGPDCPRLPEDADEGWLDMDGALLHWRGTPGADRLVLHAPAAEMAPPQEAALAIDVPGHGLSDPCPDPEAAIHAAAERLGAGRIDWPEAPMGDPERLYPDMTPDRFGTHLLRAWGAARAEAIFEPWYEANAGHARPLDPALLEPAAIAPRARARLRAGDMAARYHHILCNRKDDLS